jgi:iron complex outermembrane receptor protein
MNLRSRLFGGAMATAAFAIAGGDIALAQAAPPPTNEATQLTEIVVTARKREESLQSIPVAVTSQSAVQLQQQRITQPTDLGRVVPSLQIRNSSGSANSAQITLRGQYASDSLLGVSQPVGLYEDNVNIPHPFGANSAFFDLQRVEVLKGPQGTLYGRNTTGGAVNIITRSPDYAGIHGFAEGEAGNYGNWRFAGAVNVPVIQDVLAVRLGYQYWKRDGYGKSIVTGQDFGGDHNDQLFRLGVKFDPTSTFTATLKLEYGKADHNGAMLANISLAQPFDDPTKPITAQLATAPNSTYISAAMWQNPAASRALLFQSILTGNRSAFDTLLRNGQSVVAGCVGVSIFENCSATPQDDRLKTGHGSLDMSWDITDQVRLRSITGFHFFTNRKIFDLDGIQPQVLEVGFGNDAMAVAPSQGFFNLPYNLPADQQSRQWSQEFNLTGNAFDNHFTWLVGLYGSWDKGKGSQQAGALEELTAAIAPTGPVLFGHAGLQNFTDTWAIFTQNDVKLNDVFSITFGARYTEEKIGQDLADWTFSTVSQTFSCNGATPNGLPTTFLPAPPTNFEACANSILATGPGSIFTRAKSNGISYLLSFNFQLTPDKLLYVKTARGFRGGAFGRSAQVPASPETDTDYEIGFKADWLDKRLRTNFAAYQTNYDNKQVSTLTCLDGSPAPCTGGFTTTLRNAATARIRGVEGEFQAVPMEGLSVYGSGSWTEAVFVSWPNAVTSDGIPLVTLGIPGGNAAGMNIAVGTYGTPVWQYAIGARYERPIWDGVAAAQLDYSWRGKLPMTVINNQIQVPDAIEEEANRAVGLLNGRVEYKRADLGLTGSIWVTNLTNEHYGYLGISAGFTGGIGHLITQEPRMWGVTIRKTFGQE